VSDMSGRTNILVKAKQLGFELSADQPETKTITAKIKERENAGYEFEAAEASLSLLISETLGHRKELPFVLEEYHISVRGVEGPVRGTNSSCDATVKVRVGEQRQHTVAEGDGPVSALDAALRLALGKAFPKLRQVRLTDYKVRILDGTAGTGARTRVLITSSDGRQEWGTVGVSENIISASLEALVDSMEYALLSR